MDGQRKKFLIDTDAGVDDAQAILMALAQPDIDVVAITTTHGNTSARQVCRNVLRLLKVADRLDIPVYEGAEKSLLGTQGDSSFYHGKDGLGDVPDPDPVSETFIKAEHAVTAMISMANKYKGELTLIAIGPLTNLALAIRLDPEFGKKLKDCYIMGGNYEGKGNITPSAEFNFHTDPEAAHVVLAELGCPITMACWELCTKHSLPWEWYYNSFVGQGSIKANFIKETESKVIKTFYTETATMYQTADQIAMALAINELVKKAFVKVNCSVCLADPLVRGQMVVDWTNTNSAMAKVEIVTSLDSEYQKLRNEVASERNSFLSAVQQHSLRSVKSRGRQSWVHCDEIAVALAINKDISDKKLSKFATVELIGGSTRGQMIVDYRDSWSKKPNVNLETYDSLRSKSSRCNTFLKQVEDFGILRWRRNGEPTYVPCDELSMMCAIDPSSIVSQKSYYATVECNGQHTRGQMVIDYRKTLNKDDNVFIVTGLNIKTYIACLSEAVK